MPAFAKSDIGQVRKNNEDSYVCIYPRLYIVADGMGGHVAGEIASSLATKTVSEYVQRQDGGSPEVILGQAVNEANRIIYQMAQSNPEYAGMGTTIVVAFVDGEKVYWAYVGDSRIYLIREDGMLLLTEDHSVVWELIKSGTITLEEAKNHPHRNILTRALGTSESVRVDMGKTDWQVGDFLLLCTDGLTNMVSEQDIFQTIQRYKADGEKALEELVGRANAAGGLDNITAILVQREE